MRLLIIYLVIINVIAFIAYGIDKSRARRHRRRIRESTLLLLAVLGGSPGALIGMYVFHHKTQKMKFVIGVPLILALELIAFLTVHEYVRERRLSPARTAAAQLELIRGLDPDTVSMLLTSARERDQSTEVSQEPPDELQTGSDLDHVLNAAQAFFRQFDYRISSSNISGDTATVQVSISNIDTRALAHDICLELSRRRFEFSGDSGLLTHDGYLDMISQCLSTHTYPVTETQAQIHLMWDTQSRRWTILTDQSLTQALTGYFETYIDDPYILSAQEVLTQYLDALAGMSAAQWMDYLKPEDIFQTSSISYSDQLDILYMEKVAQYFSYEVLSSTQDGSEAAVRTRITSVDMQSVLTIYKEKLLAYASTADSITDDSSALSDSTARYLIEALQENTDTTSADLSISLNNDGTAWQVNISDELTDALLGGIREALEVIRN